MIEEPKIQKDLKIINTPNNRVLKYMKQKHKIQRKKRQFNRVVAFNTLLLVIGRETRQCHQGCRKLEQHYQLI